MSDLISLDNRSKASTIVSRYSKRVSKEYYQRSRLDSLWNGRLWVVTLHLMSLPWKMQYQIVLMTSIVLVYIGASLQLYMWDTTIFGRGIMIGLEVIFVLDVLIALAHAFWKTLRARARVVRRNIILVTYDSFSAIMSIFGYMNFGFGRSLYLFISWIRIVRIYRLSSFFVKINDAIILGSTANVEGRNTTLAIFIVLHFYYFPIAITINCQQIHVPRFLFFIFENLLITVLFLHMMTCMWHYMRTGADSHVVKVTIDPLEVDVYDLHERDFNTYLNCLYYCTCRLFNVVFGDNYPGNDLEKYHTALTMVAGFSMWRCSFVAMFMWELIVSQQRWFKFIDRYEHVMNYLSCINAPPELIARADSYQRTVWRMKIGVLARQNSIQSTSSLPAPLLMELAFDINVQYLHRSMLFSSLSESFLRQISMLMRNEFLLAGDEIWRQGVVKTRMLCVARGVLELLSDEDDESPIISFKEGTVLGELSLMYCIPAKVTVKAATYVEIQVLDKTDFARAMKEHPGTMHTIQELLKRRIDNAKDIEDAIAADEQKQTRRLHVRYRPMKVLKDALKGVQEEDNFLSDDKHLYYKDKHNNKYEKFQKGHLQLYRVSENVTMLEEPRICWSSTFPWIMEPDTDFTRTCDMIHLGVVLLACVLVPLHVAFTRPRAHAPIVHAPGMLADVLRVSLLLQLCLQLTTAIVTKTERITSLKGITNRKMATVGFYVDVMSVFPTEVFTDWDVGGRVIQYAQFSALLQFWHVWDYMLRWEKRFSSKARYVALARYAVVILILCYWAGCLMYLVACPKALCLENRWMEKLIYRESKVYTSDDVNHINPILTSWFFGTVTLLIAGTNEVSPGEHDAILIMIVILAGSILLTIYTANVCSIYMLAVAQKVKFLESIRDMLKFLSLNHVTVKIRRRIKKFFSAQWIYNRGVQTNKLLASMSGSLKQEVLSMEMVDTLLKSPLYQEVDHDFLQTIATRAKIIVLPENEIVQNSGDINRDMYIIQKGHCNLLDHKGKVVKILGPGDSIGDMSTIFGLPKVFSAITCTNCALLHIEYQSLVQSLSMFPEVDGLIKGVVESQDRKQLEEFEVARPMSGRVGAKKNRLANELKDSFMMMVELEGREMYEKEFDKLGILRYIKYIVVPITITPYGSFLKAWCMLRFFFAVIYVLFGPYYIAVSLSSYVNYGFWTDYFLYLDVLVMGYVGYFDSDGLLVSHPLRTIAHYMARGFVLDLLCVFPFEVLIGLMNTQADFDLCRINKLLMFHRVTSTFDYLEENISSVNLAVVLLKFLPMAVTLVNLATTVVFRMSCEVFLDGDVLKSMCKETPQESIVTKRAAQAYVEIFYTMFQCFLGRGVMAFSASGVLHLCLTTLLTSAGALYFAHVYGHIACTRSTSALRLLEHKEKLTDLENFLFQENVDSGLTRKTLKYFDYVWKRTNGTNAQKACSSLHTNLHEETLLCAYERALRDVPALAHAERSFVRALARHVNEAYFVKGEAVVLSRDVQPYIYIIYRGKVDVMSSYSEMITCMGPGGLFGNFTGLPSACSEVSIYASRNLDLLMIPAQTFFGLVKFYPKVMVSIHQAFQAAKDYIMPVSIETEVDISEDSYSKLSSDSNSITSKSTAGSSADTASQSRSMVSRSNSRSNFSSRTSNLSGSRMRNLRRPGSSLFQVAGYTKVIISACSYMWTVYCIVTLNTCRRFYWYITIFDVYFYLHLFLKIHEGYVDRLGEMITDCKRCRQRYFGDKLNVWTDIIINFPVDSIAFAFPAPHIMIFYLRVVRLGRLKYLIQFYRKTSFLLTNNMTALQSTMMLLAVAIAIHTFALLWLVVSMLTNPTFSDKPLSFTDPSIMWDYASSLYLVCCVLTSTSSFELDTSGVSHSGVIAILLSLGKLGAGALIGAAYCALRSSGYTRARYERQALELADELESQGLSSFQLQKYWKYAEDLWTYERGRQLPLLIQQASLVRRCELMSAMFGSHLRTSCLFLDAPEPFLRQLCCALQYMVFFRGNYIVQAGDRDASAYFVHAGLVSVVSARPDRTEREHATLSAPDAFGLVQGLHRAVPHTFSYRAETKVSILILKLDAWADIMPFFPDAQAAINRRAETMFARF